VIRESRPPQVLLIVAIAFGMTLAACGDDSPTHPTGNRPPSIARQPDTTAVLGRTLSITPSASDADGDSVVLRLVVFLTFQELHEGYAPNARFDQANKTFNYRPSARDIPGREFEFVADDNRGGRDSTRFFVAVSEN
jgi:hypothetical protein